MDKSSIHFAKGVSGSTRDEIMNTLEVHNEALSEKYLGMPTDVGTATNGAFKYLKRSDVEESSRMDGTDFIGRWQRSTNQGGGASCADVLDVLLQSTAGLMPTFRQPTP